MSLVERHLQPSEGRHSAELRNPRVPPVVKAECCPKVLTDREREILIWIAEGKSDATIGQILSISSKTVNYHVENAKRKFEVATRIQAVIAAIKHDLLVR